MTTFQRNLAIIIGINSYEHGIPGLHTAVNDARKFAAILHYRHNYEVILLLDHRATLPVLRKLLNEKLPVLVGPDDRVLIYFAGHGQAHDALEGEDGPVGYLFPQDARRDDVNSLLPMIQLHDALIALPCHHLLLILDCCFAGAFRWFTTRDVRYDSGTLYQEQFDRFVSDPAWQVITSAGYDQRAFDVFGKRSGHQHSPFAQALFEAVDGAADLVSLVDREAPSGDGVVTATELYLYLRNRMEKLTSGLPKQTPGLWPLRKHDKGEYIFLVPGHTINLPLAPTLNYDTNPYRGLQSFEERHQDLFFGRTKLIDELQQLVATQPLTVVLGASGTGKSSLVQAGLLPRLRQNAEEDWQILDPIRPGMTPSLTLGGLMLPGDSVTSLTKRITLWRSEHEGTHLLIIVDQFEELLSLCRDETDRDQFQHTLAEALYTHGDVLYIVLTLRSGFEPQFTTGPLQQLWTAKARYIISPMRLEELREAITGPAERRILFFEPNHLIDRLINEVTQVPEALPLLSFALSELYICYINRRSNARTLTEDDYVTIGGVAGAVSVRMSKEYQQLSTTERETMRRVLLRMVSIEGGELSRRRVLYTDLIFSDPSENTRVTEVVQRLVDARLLVEGRDEHSEPYIEPAHDELIRGWSLLVQWTSAEQETLVLQQRLSQAAQIWDEGKRKKGFLWTNNPRLDYLDRVRSTSENWLNRLEMEFVIQSIRQRRFNLRFLVTSLIITTVIFATLGLISLFLRNTAEQQRRFALARQLAAQSEVLREQDPHLLTRSILLAIESLSIHQTFEGDQALRHGLTLLPVEEAKLPDPPLKPAIDQNITSLAFSPDGRWLAAGALDERVQIWETTTWREVMRVKPAVDPNIGGEELWMGGSNNQRIVAQVRGIAFSPDSRWLVTCSDGGIAQVWDVTTGHEVARINQEMQLSSVAFSPDGNWVASGSDTIWVWEASTGRKIAEGPGWGLFSFSPDSRFIASGSADSTNAIVIWEAATGRIVRQMEDAGYPSTTQDDSGYDPASSVSFSTLAFSPDGQLLAAGEGLPEGVSFWPPTPLKGRIVVWKVSTGELISSMEHSDTINSLSFSPDNRRIVSGSNDGTARIWDAKTGIEIQRLSHLGAVTGVQYSTNGRAVMSASRDGTARVWDAETGEARTWMIADQGIEAEVLAVNPQQDRIAIGDNHGQVWVWKIASQERLQLPHSGTISSLTFSPDGKSLVSAGLDRMVHKWDVTTGQEQMQGKHTDEVAIAVMSPDGRYIASGGYNGEFKVWDATKGREVLNAPSVEIVASIAFSPDSRLVAFSEGNPPRDGWSIMWNWRMTRRITPVSIWDLHTGQEVARLTHQGPINSIAFSPDGRWLVSGSDDSTARVWDVMRGAEIARVYHSRRVNLVAFSPNGRWVVSAEACFPDNERLGTVDPCNSRFKLWAAATGEEIWQAKSDSSWMSAVAFSPDSHFIATANNQVSGCPKDVESCKNTVRVWEVATGREISSITHDNTVNTVTFSPDSQRIASGSADRTVRIWEPGTGQELARFTHPGEVWAVAFSPDGRWIASGGRDEDRMSFARIFPVQPNDLIAMACARLARNLLLAEWQSYLPGEQYRETCPDLPNSITPAVSLEQSELVSDVFQAKRDSYTPSISADGRYIAFRSDAENLVLNDTNDSSDVFVYDRQVRRLERVSVASDGSQANGGSFSPVISADGNYIAFESGAISLYHGDVSDGFRMFLHERSSRQTTWVPMEIEGKWQIKWVTEHAISADGHIVAFCAAVRHNLSDEVDPNDQVFTYDRKDGKIKMISLGIDGNQSNGASRSLIISGDGHTAIFESTATNLAHFIDGIPVHYFIYDQLTNKTSPISIPIEGDPDSSNFQPLALSFNGHHILYTFWKNVKNSDGSITEFHNLGLFNRDTSRSTILSLRNDNRMVDGEFYRGMISENGRYIVFESNASDLVIDDTNGVADIFVYDVQTGKTTRVSVTSEGIQANAFSSAPGISSDGRYIVFASAATNIVANDTNGASDIFLYDQQTHQTSRISVPNQAGK